MKDNADNRPTSRDALLPRPPAVFVDENTSANEDGAFKSFLRVQRYTDLLGCVLNVAGLIAAIAAGCALPLMNLVFGHMITTFTNKATGATSPADFDAQLNKFTYVTDEPD